MTEEQTQLKSTLKPPCENYRAPEMSACSVMAGLLWEGQGLGVKTWDRDSAWVPLEMLTLLTSEPVSMVNLCIPQLETYWA